MSGIRVVTLGEIMLRLKPPGYERLLQSPTLEATFGGAESNVAIALAGYGIPTAFVTALPANAIGDAAIGELRRHGVDTARILRAGERVGIYFLETGAAHRPPRVLYDRAGSSLSMTHAGSFDWAAIFRGAEWFHVSGITPAVSESAAQMCLEAVTVAQQNGITVSCDYNYRAGLWQYGKPAPAVMREIMSHVNVGIAGREDCQNALGIDVRTEKDSADPDLVYYSALAQAVLEEFPNMDKQIITLRESRSANRNGWSACLHNRTEFMTSRRYDIDDIVDRVGTGDAFSAGFIYGSMIYRNDARALEFATAAGCLKHSVPGDVNRTSVAETEALLAGDGTGRVQR